MIRNIFKPRKIKTKNVRQAKRNCVLLTLTSINFAFIFSELSPDAFPITNNLFHINKGTNEGKESH